MKNFCMFPIEIPTNDEGDVFFYVTKSVEDDFLIHTGIESDRSAESTLKHVYLLMEHPEFIERRSEGFSLYLHKYEEVSSSLESILGLEGGQLEINQDFVAQEMAPVIKSLYDSFRKG